MRAMFIRGADPKDAMGIGDPKARLAQSLKELCGEMGYEFRYNKRGTPRMVVPVKYTLDTYGVYNATKKWKHGQVREIHYTLTYMPHRQEDGPISLRKIWCGYDGDAGPYGSTAKWDSIQPLNDIKQSLMGRFHSFPEIIEPLKISLKKEKEKSFDITKLEQKQSEETKAKRFK